MGTTPWVHRQSHLAESGHGKVGLVLSGGAQAMHLSTEQCANSTPWEEHKWSLLDSNGLDHKNSRAGWVKLGRLWGSE